ncbi:hypothetical protein [uncultured Erythrobacter sp.]|uniref:hypothetical protein n=1 Tax=uncultured Erythrobacter sp. TaxID=263913 RepID=UPI00262EA393|nr:hypothetical protein [uncultured Erythrobacter sp.]
MKRATILLAPLLLLATACEDSADPDTGTTEQGGEVAGDVLGGSISDDMIPLEELQSQSPPAERSADDAEEAASDDAASSE